MNAMTGPVASPEDAHAVIDPKSYADWNAALDLFDRLRAKSIHAVFAGIALPNPASIALHEAMGMVPVGIYREVGWKLGGWRDVGWWQRLL